MRYPLRRVWKLWTSITSLLVNELFWRWQIIKAVCVHFWSSMLLLSSDHFMSHKQQFSDCYVIFYYGRNQEIYGFLKLVIVTQALKDFLIYQRLIVNKEWSSGRHICCKCIKCRQYFFFAERTKLNACGKISLSHSHAILNGCAFFPLLHIVGQSSLVSSGNVTETEGF